MLRLMWASDIYKGGGVKALLAVIVLLLSVGCSSVTYDGRILREPVGNACLSGLMPGWGQFCNEEYIKGAAFMGGWVALSMMHAEMTDENDDCWIESRSVC